MRLDLKTPDSQTSRQGFTIVELLIVIVVIGILAAITIVAYTGIQQQAAAVVLKSDLSQATSQLELDHISDGSYPGDDSSLPRSEGTNFQYTPTGDDYCLSASSDRAGSTAFHINSTSGTIQEGVCSGHTAPGGGGGATENQGVVTTLAGSTSGYADGTGSAAQFDAPSGVTVDDSGVVYVADSYNNRIRRITSSGEVTTLAGSTGGYAEGTGAAAQFYAPQGVSTDSAGSTIYVADPWNDRIRKVTAGGVVTTLAGSTFGYADGTGAAAKFRNPISVAVGPSGAVYVADEQNNRIRKVTASGVVTTLAGSTQGYADGTGAAAQFDKPRGIAVDSSGTVYVVDTYNDRIRKITSGGVVTTLAGSTQGYAEGTGSASQFDRPQDLAVDSSGVVYVADTDNNRIRKITPSGVVTTLAGSTSGYADGTGAAAQFDRPFSVAVDPSGVVYVADLNNDRIRKIE